MKRVHLPRPILGCLVIFLAVLICSVGSFFAVDRVCVAYLPQRLPIYPGAKIVIQNHNFATAFGMGTTAVTLYSPDPPEKVRTWYGQTVGAFLKQSINSSDFITYLGRQIARVQYDITEAPPPNETGTQIILYAQCVD